MDLDCFMKPLHILIDLTEMRGTVKDFGLCTDAE